MKVIDLLNKIANGEEGDLTTYFIFGNENFNFYKFSNKYAIDINSLNWEIELEDKKIEKIEPTNYCIDNLREKINEIIDYINGSGKE